MPDKNKKSQADYTPEELEAQKAAVQAKDDAAVAAASQPRAQVVQIPIEDYKALQSRLDKLEADNQTLLAVADRGRLAAEQAKDGKPLAPTVKLSTFMGEDGVRRVVAAWRMTKDEVYKGPNGAWIEDQQVEIILEDDSKKTLILKDFYRLTAEKIRAEIKTRSADGQTLTVVTDDGKERVIGIAFVN